tara:strand:+ start:301 stop:576 length:276 start_codon:yes stop_codon:yes gene_type:complete
MNSNIYYDNTFISSSIKKVLPLPLFIVFAFLSCASTNDDAIWQQEDFIKIHPTWKGHDFKFEKRKPQLNAEEIIEKINAKLDSIILSHDKN